MSLFSLRKVRVSIPAFWRGEDGSPTVEFVLWFPFFIVVVMAGGHMALIFFGQAVALDAAQYATRAYSVGELSSEAEVRGYVQANLSSLSSNVTVQSSVTNNLITTYVSLPAADIGGPLQFLGAFQRTTIAVKAQHRKEF